jgi:hypothetical protein
MRKIIIAWRLKMKKNPVVLLFLTLSIVLIGYAGAEGSSLSGNADLMTAIQQRDALDVSALLQARWIDPPMVNDTLFYLDISTNPYGDDVAIGWMIEPNYNYGGDLYGFVIKNHLVGRTWDEYGTCFIIPVVNPTTVDGCFYEEEEETILTYNMDLWSPPTTLPEYESWFWESFRDEVADNWVPLFGSWVVDDSFEDLAYNSYGTGTAGWRGSYYRYLYDTADAEITYSLNVRDVSFSSDNEQTLVVLADPADPAGNCYEFSIKYGPPETYTLRKVSGGVPTNLIDPTQSIDIDVYDSNRLTVIADMVAGGLEITLYINDEFQASMIDNSTPHTSGAVGIGIHDTTGWGIISFSEILLHRVTPSLLPPSEAGMKSGGKAGRAGGFFGK